MKFQLKQTTHTLARTGPMKGWRLTSTAGHLAHPSHACTLGLRKGVFMLPSGIPPDGRQPAPATAVGGVIRGAGLFSRKSGVVFT